MELLLSTVGSLDQRLDFDIKLKEMKIQRSFLELEFGQVTMLSNSFKEKDNQDF